MATVRKRPCSLKLFQFRLFLLSTCFLISFLSPDHFTSLPFYIFISFAYIVEYLLNARTQPSSFTSSINLFPLYRFSEKNKERMETSTYFQKPFKTTIYLFLFFFLSFFYYILPAGIPWRDCAFRIETKELSYSNPPFFFSCFVSLFRKSPRVKGLRTANSRISFRGGFVLLQKISDAIIPNPGNGISKVFSKLSPPPFPYFRNRRFKRNQMSDVQSGVRHRH